MRKRLSNWRPFYNIMLSISILLLVAFLVDRGSFGYYYTLPDSLTLRYHPGHGSGLFFVGVTCLALVFVVAALFMIPKKSLKCLSDFQTINLVFLLMIAAIWSLITILIYGPQVLLTQTTSSFVFMLAFAVFLGTNDKVWELVGDWSFIVALLAIPLALYYVVSFSDASGLRISNSPQIIYLSTGFWPLAISALCFKQKRFNRLITPILLIMALMTAIIYVSRGWIIQCLLLTVFYAYKRLRDANRKASLTKLLIFIFVLLLFSVAVIKTWFTPYYDLLFERLFEDTRTWQYSSLFSQYGFFDFLIGKGLFATYTTTVYGEYRYIDNMFVFTMFRYGIFFMLSYLFLIISPILRLLRRKSLSYIHKMPAAILFLWFLALVGVSVYNAQMVDIKCLFIFILIGRCYRCASIPSPGTLRLSAGDGGKTSDTDNDEEP